MLLTYLRLFRVHTAALTWAIALLGYGLAGGKIFSIEAFLFAFFGFLWHLVGFTDNNVFDYQYDVKDPAKQHFPLVKGQVTVWDADLIVKIGVSILAVYGAWLAQAKAPALVAMLIGITTGFIYNRYNKVHLWKPIPISLCFAAVPMFTFLSTGQSPNFLTWLVMAYVFMQVWYQIAVSGEMKEIEIPAENNILRKLGARVSDGELIIPTKAGLFIAVSKSVHLVIGASVAFIMGTAWYAIPFAGAIIFFYTQQSSSRWDRKKKLMQMSLVEMFSYYLIVVALWPTLGLYESVFLLFGATLWFLGLNRLLWKTGIGPRV